MVVVIIIKMLNQPGGIEKLKIIMNGNSSSGISSLSLRYVENRYHDDYIPTIGVDFRIKMVQPLGVKLYIWQTRGGQRFRSITRAYYRGAHGVITTYNITDRTSFQAVPNWIQEAQNSAGEGNFVKILVGTHLDQTDRREVTEQEGLEMAKRYNCRFYEASAKDGTNVKEVFENLTLDIISLLGYSEQNRALRLQKLREPVKLWSSGPVNKTCC